MAVQQSKVTACQADMHPGQGIIANEMYSSRHSCKNGVLPGAQVDTGVKAISAGNRVHAVTIA